MKGLSCKVCITGKEIFFYNVSDLSLDVALEEGDHLNELSLRPEYDRTFSVMSRKPLYAPMMETIKPYRDRLIQAKRQLDEAWKGETAAVPVVTSSQPDDVHELRENLTRVSIIHWMSVYFFKRIGQFQITFSLFLKASLGAHPFI